MKNKLLLLMVALITISINTFSQAIFTVDNKTSEIRVTGTSTLHDWEMTMTEVAGQINAVVIGSDLKEIKDGRIICITKNLKSESKMMDSKAYDALREEDNPQITFTIISISDLISKTGFFNGVVTGDLMVAGKLKRLSLPFNGSIDSKGIISIAATTSFNMSLFEIKPPTAMFGTIASGDKIGLVITIHLTSGK